MQFLDITEILALSLGSPNARMPEDAYQLQKPTADKVFRRCQKFSNFTLSLLCSNSRHGSLVHIKRAYLRRGLCLFAL